MIQCVGYSGELFRLPEEYFPDKSGEWDWPKAYTFAVAVCVRPHHCGCEDCCGVVTPAQRRAALELACDLTGADYPPRTWWDWEEEGL